MTEATRTAHGKVWLITGTSTGLGREIAKAALDAGDTVIATARNVAAVEDLAAAYPDRCVAAALDVTDQVQIRTVVNDAIFWFGRVDVLVNNAGRGILGAVEEATDADLRALMELHYFGPAALIREVLPHMRARRSGAIVQMSSMGGQLAFAGVGAYCATKFALEGLSEALAAEVAPHGIKVLIVEPGAFRTSFNGGNLNHSPSLEAYADVMGPLRQIFADVDGRQPGDPAKAAAAIRTALDAEKTPLRLALGNDAVDGILAHAEGVRGELLEWEEVGRATVFED